MIARVAGAPPTGEQKTTRQGGRQDHHWRICRRWKLQQRPKESPQIYASGE